MRYAHARHSLPHGFLAVCEQVGVKEDIILAHLDSDEFYRQVDDVPQHARLAQQLILTQKHKTANVVGVLAMYDVAPERAYNLLEAGLTAENARRYAGRNLTPDLLERTYRHNIDLGVLDELIESTKMPFENMAILLANRIPVEWLHEYAGQVPAYQQHGAPFRLFHQWVSETSSSDLPDDYLEEMFLGAL